MPVQNATVYIKERSNEIMHSKGGLSCHGNSGMGDTEVQHRNPKHIQFGLEVPKALTYHGWEPGCEYTKSLVIRNVQIKTQKIRYK